MMRLTIRNGVLYIDNLRFCLVEPGNGCTNLPPGRYPVATEYSHVHGALLPNAIGLGWLGNLRECVGVLGTVRGRDGLIPSSPVVCRLLALLEIAEGAGKEIVLEVCE